MKYPIISIVIATFNSDRILPKTLGSIKKQTYPQNKIEVLVIDGGSTDKTLSIAKKYDCKIIRNSKIQYIFAKHTGFFKAQGKYLIYLDHDEILENPKSLKLKYLSFKKNPLVKAVMPSGYKTPSDYSLINNYINEFGDPFSFFMYRESKDDKALVKGLSSKYRNRKIYEDGTCIIFSFFNLKPLPLIELWAGGCMIDLRYARFSFPQIKRNPALIAHLFYLLNSKNTLIAVNKNDNTIHYSADSFVRYLKKLSIRVENNIYQNTTSYAGFSGREQFHPFWFRLKKYLFIPYTLLIVPAAIDSIYLTLTKKQLLYLLHLPLCIYTTFLILYNLLLKTLRY